MFSEWPTRTRIADRDHRCVYCGKTIAAGTPFHATSWWRLEQIPTRRKHVGCTINDIPTDTDHLF